jgi:ketosteroid isomerase-like protein
MDRQAAERFAQDWIRGWCARDVDLIVSHFTDDARFVSPVAARVTGSPLVVGRDAISRYWQVVHTFRTFQFTLERTIWDGDTQELAIIYTREVDGRHDRACEILRFDSSGKVTAGEGMYGAEWSGS